MSLYDPFLNDFLQEAREHLATIETDLLAMEAPGEQDKERVNRVFRAAHSIKGGAGFFTLGAIQKLAHSLENVLALVRTGEMVPTGEVVNLLLLGFDRLRARIDHPAEGEEMDDQDLLASLLGLAARHLPPGGQQALSTPATLPALGGKCLLVGLSEFDLSQARKKGMNVFVLELDLLHDVQRRGSTPWSLLKKLMSCGTVLDCAWNLEAVGTLEDAPGNAIPLQVLYSTPMDAALVSSLVGIPGERITEVPRLASQAAQPDAPQPPQPEAPQQPEPEAPQPPLKPLPAPAAAPRETPPETSIRVSLAVLEQLMNLAGEMVLGRNELLDAIQRGDPRQILAGAQRISLVTGEFQAAVLLARMQPIGNILNRFPRVVRDLAKEVGKEIELTLEGKDVELDRSILEGLSDPLTHMVRNAVDHGIETPERRRSAGKPGPGTLEIKAFQEAGQVVLEIRDDGQGLDTGRIGAKAVEKGLLTREQLLALSPKEQLGLILLPGLSTAPQISTLSGRGVGMDVVKTNITKLGGTLEIESRPGQGSTFRIRVPLTLAIVPSLLVSVGQERFAIPQAHVLELIRLAPGEARQRIEGVGDSEVLELRGQLIPLVRLGGVLGIKGSYLEPASGAPRRERRWSLGDRRRGFRAREEDRRRGEEVSLNLVVVSAGMLTYALVVEALHDTVEVVVKPLGRHLKARREYAGATILGDGGVALILDATGLAGLLGLGCQAGMARAAAAAAEQETARLKGRQPFLLFCNGPGERCAVPLEQVARVERLTRASIETAGGRRTTRYRGGSLPLVALADAAEVEAFGEEQELIVIVFTLEGREVGLLGALPVDSLELDLGVDLETHRQPGVAGSLILRDRTTLLLDLFEIAARTLGGIHPPETQPLPRAHDEEFLHAQ